MSPENFVYWLQGRAELLPDQPPTAEEWKMIREHLALVFNKVTPPLGTTVWPRSPSMEHTGVLPGPSGVPGFHRPSDLAQRIMQYGGAGGVVC